MIKEDKIPINNYTFKENELSIIGYNDDFIRVKYYIRIVYMNLYTQSVFIEYRKKISTFEKVYHLHYIDNDYSDILDKLKKENKNIGLYNVYHITINKEGKVFSCLNLNLMCDISYIKYLNRRKILNDII